MDKKVSFGFQHDTRRGFIRKGSLLIASATAAGLSGIAVACRQEKHDENDKGRAQEEKGEKEEEEEEVSANEDLMREHGLLQRMLLIYDTAMARISKKEDFNTAYINQTATIIRDFIEDYHEKLEEDHLFPRLEKANRLTSLVNTLRQQHKGGRDVTAQVLELTKNGARLKDDEGQRLLALMQSFNTMYRPHEAREDTVLFPAFKEVVSSHEYDSMGEDFEKIEHQKFGGDGFDQMVDRVAGIEKQIGIYELDQFMPKV